MRPVVLRATSTLEIAFTAHPNLSPPRTTRFRVGIAFVIALALAPLSLYAQTVPKRLSDWILEQVFDPGAYPLGLSWRVPEEIAPQSELRVDLLKSLSGVDADVKADPRSLRRLRNWVRMLPVTGRVAIAAADPRWLQANPARDPILRPGQTVVLPRRPRSVTVVTEKGERCAVTHSEDLEVMAYVRACSGSESHRADWAWIAQPDGRVQRFGVATWSREKQDQPAPGAWIWAPSRDGGWPIRLSQQLITFLATQGPAPDPSETALLARAASKTNVDDGSNECKHPSAAYVSDEACRRSLASVLGGASDGWRTPALQYFGRVVPNIEGVSGLPGEGATGANDAVSTSIILPPPERQESTLSRNLEITAGDFGGAGLLQTPSARMQKAGNLSVNFSRVYPYLQSNVIVQPFSWLEAGFRYTNISNRLYSQSPEFSGNQAYKDKSFDAKFRLASESAYVPQVALGFRDFAGTGLFSGEYLVASKRAGPLDWNLGLGWGYVGARGNIRNPLGLINSSFDTRKAAAGSGNFSLGSYFHGPTALFGGVQYQTPWEPLILKLEYDGNDYQHEGQGNVLRQSSPWNLGLLYRAGRNVDISLAVERGNTAMLGVTLHTQLDGLSMPKLNDPPRIPVSAGLSRGTLDWSATAREVALQTDWNVRRIEQRGRELRVILDDAEAVYWQDRVDRVAAVLNRDAPPSVDRFALAYRVRGIDVAEHVIDRDAWVAQKTQALPPHDQRVAVVAQEAERLKEQPALFEHSPPVLETGLGPNYQQSFGGPNGFILFQAGAVEQIKLRVRDDTWLQGSLQLGLIDNYNRFTVTGPSLLPRVRTYVREYVTTSKLTLPNLQATRVARIGERQYYSVYGGYLEPMFAGVGGEWLYRPFASRLAFGIDANLVKQRNFAQDLGFNHAGDQTGYRVATGHATWYWDTGWHDMLLNISAGRYLAKDFGATVGMSRVFENGVKVGAFFTRTNISAVKFGEGSFDKGVYVSVPFDAFLTKSSNTVANVVWRPITRDGGAKLYRAVELYDLTKARDNRTLRYKAAPPPNDETIPEDRRDAWTPPPKGPVAYTRVTPKPTTAQWGANAGGYEQRLIEALYQQQFRNIRVAYDPTHRLTVALTHDDLRPISRAVGRAARTALHLGPLEMREIRIEFAERAEKLVTYDFADLRRLERYFDGEINADQLADSVAVEYRDPAARQADPLAQLGDVDTKAEEKTLADVLLPDTRTAGRVKSDFASAARTAADTNWSRLGLLGTGLVLASSALDRRADDFAKNHANNRWLKGVNSFGDALPWIAAAGAVASAFGANDPILSRTGYSASEAGGTAFLAVYGLKSVFGRARPYVEAGSHTFKPFSKASGYDSFPSGHTIVAWAVATPFAEQYDAPWLYGLAAVTNVARVGSRNHWVSDTVAGSVLGYAIGKIFYESSRAQRRGEPRVLVHPAGVNVTWDLN